MGRCGWAVAGAMVAVACVELLGTGGPPPAARPPLPQAEDVADIPAQHLSAGGDERMRYILIGPRPGEGRADGEGDAEGAPPDGYKLLLVLPGGDGGVEFHPFIKRIHKSALSDDYLVAQLVAPAWSEEQRQSLVWPTRASTVPEAAFSTEEFIEAVVADVKQRVAVDDRFVFTLSWSSGGPAAYAAALQERTPVTGSFVAMSVFKPETLPPLEHAAGRAFFILHSPEDRVCPFPMAERARDDLREHGATVEFKTYAGGHGWRGGVYRWIRAGVAWLEAEAGGRKGERR